jgi:uncharacterized protein
VTLAVPHPSRSHLAIGTDPDILDVRVLSIDGGGYLGLASAAFLAESERHFGTRAAERFDLFCGTSTGAIIALALAMGMTGDQIVELYRDLGPRVFPPWKGRFWFMRWLAWTPTPFRAKHQNEALRAALKNAFGDTTLGDIHASGKRVVVTAFNVSTGRPRVFKTDHADGLSTDSGYRLVDVALASAAAPIFFPLVKLRRPGSAASDVYCDGGVAANSPALIGFVEAVDRLRHRPETVEILSISTPREDLAERSAGHRPFDRGALNRGVVGWGGTLLSVMLDAPAMLGDSALTALGRVQGVGPGRYERITFARPKCADLDIATRAATEALVHAGVECGTHAATRLKLQPFFA